MEIALKTKLWAEEHSGHCWKVLNQTFDPRAARTAREILNGIEAAPVVPRSVVEAIWLIPILHLLRGYSFVGSPYVGEALQLDREVERLLGDLNELGSADSGSGAFDEVTRVARDLWDLEANGYWALLRLHRATESDFARFKEVLDRLVLPDGPLPRRLIAPLSLMPVGFWNPAPQNLEVRVELQREILPRLARILGEPFPGAVTQILKGVSITDFR